MDERKRSDPIAVKFVWSSGFRAPKGVTAESVGQALQEMDDPSPEAMLDESKAEGHPLHRHIWSEGDQVWAQRGRLEECRKIISSVCKVEMRGSKTIQVRAVEFVKSKWTPIESIVGNTDLENAYEDEILRQVALLQGKLTRYFELRRMYRSSDT